MLPKGMNVKELCDVCHKEMEIDHSLLRSDESAVEVWYKCKHCSYEIGFAYADGFIQAYKERKDYPGQPSKEEPSMVAEEQVGVQGEKR